MRHTILSIVFLLLLLSSCNRGPVLNDDDARRYNKISDSLYVAGHRQEAVKFIDSVCGRSQGSVLARYFVYSRKEQFELEKKNYAQAILYDDSMRALIEQNNLQQKYTREYVHALLEKGLIFSNNGKYDSAYNEYMNGYKLVLKSGDQCMRHEFDYYLGMVAYKQDNRAQAREFFKKSFAEACDCESGEKPWYRMQELLDNIGLCYKADSGGREYFDSCISFIHHNEDKFPSREMVASALSTCYKNKGMRIMAARHFAEAKENLTRSFEVYQLLDSVKYRDVILKSKLAYGMALYFADDTAGVVALHNQLLPQADTVQSSDIRELWLQFNYMYHEMRLDFKQAYIALTDFEEYRSTHHNYFKDNSTKDITQDMANLEQNYKIQLLTKEQQIQRISLWVAIVLSCLAGVIIALIYRNYKRTRKANEIIGRQKAALEASNVEKDGLIREKDGILNVVAHDLRNPIGSISFIADMMLMEDGTAMEPDEAFGMIKSASIGSLQLVDELLEVARNDKSTLKKVPTDVSGLVQDSVAALKYKADEKEQQLVYQADEQAGTLTIDKEKMARVINNLVTNAIKFSPKGGRIEVMTAKHDNGVVIKVADNGIGIPADKLPGLFQMFTNARRKGTANEESFGLGLAICKQIVDAHGGTLSVDSTEGQGSTFVITLPG